MKEKPGPDPTFLQIQQARQLLDHGHHRQALALALDALLQELYQLRDSLEGLKNSGRSDPETPEEPRRPSPARLSKAKLRIVH
jgi:hypothetical protein